MDSHSASEALGVRSDVQSVSDLPAQRRTPTSAPRHRLRDGPKRKPARELPKELPSRVGGSGRGVGSGQSLGPKLHGGICIRLVRAVNHSRYTKSQSYSCTVRHLT